MKMMLIMKLHICGFQGWKVTMPSPHIGCLQIVVGRCWWCSHPLGGTPCPASPWSVVRYFTHHLSHHLHYHHDQDYYWTFDQVLISDIQNTNNNISSTYAYHHHDHLSSDLVEMGSDILLLLAWQVNTVPRSSRCKGPTWSKLSHFRQLRSFQV